MKYTLRIQYNDGTIVGWITTDHSLVKFILYKENKRYGKQIKRLILKGEHV
jgi:hypothetical protein